MSTQPGFTIDSLDPSGTAARAGLQPGDVLVAVDAKSVGSLEDIEAAVEPNFGNLRQRSFTFEILRRGRKEFVSVHRGDLGIKGASRTPEEAAAAIRARYIGVVPPESSGLAQVFSSSLYQSIQMNLLEPLKFVEALCVSIGPDHLIVSRENVIYMIPFSSLLAAQRSEVGVTWTLTVRHQVIYKGYVGAGISVPLSFD
jgi:membrane-associated protease RseP (regulator of RpoE activity)